MQVIRNRFDGFVTERDWLVMADKKLVNDATKRNSSSISLAEIWQANVSLQFGRIFDTRLGQVRGAELPELSRPLAAAQSALLDLAASNPAVIDIAGATLTRLLKSPTAGSTPAPPATGVPSSTLPASDARRSAVVRSTYSTGDGAEYVLLAGLIGGDIDRLAESIRQLQLTQVERGTFQSAAAGLTSDFVGQQQWIVGSTDVDYHGSSCPHCRHVPSTGGATPGYDLTGPQRLGNGGGGGGGINNFPPRVTLTARDIEVGKSFLMSEIFQYSDLDGNPMTALRVIDRSGEAESGYLWFRGQRIAANQWIEVAADQVQFLRFFAGVQPLRDNIGMMVSDGQFWSTTALGDVRTIRPNLFPPSVQGFDGEVLAYEAVKIVDFFRASDPENDLRTIRFIDRQNNPNSGYFSINGVVQDQNRWFEVSVDQIDSINYHGGLNGQAEFVAAQVYDGRFWSNVANFRMQTIPNVHRPGVVAPDLELKSGQVIQVSNWITYSDADGNTAKRYRFYDTGSRAEGGYFTVDGQVQTANSWFEVTAPNLHTVRYHASEVADFEKFRVMAFDGRFWSDIATGSVTVRVKPITDLPDLLLVRELEQVALRDVFQVNGNGLSVKTVQVFVPFSPAGGPTVRLAGSVLAENRFYEMTWQQFQSLTYVGGSGGDSAGRYFNELLVRFDNGVAWSSWERVDTVTEVLANAALTTGTSWSAFPGQPVEVTYSFPLTVPFYYEDDADERNENVLPLNGIQQQRMREALEMYSEYANITFREVPDSVGGMMRFMFTGMDEGILGWAYFPNAQRPNQSVQGDIWFNAELLASSDFADGTEAWLTAIHEIGHAVGLGHPFTTPGETGPQLPSATNNHLFTQMSYTRIGQLPYVRNQLASSGESYGIDTIMLYDIMEIQRLYGATAEQNHDNTVYRWTNQPFRETVRDTGGFDTIDASNFGTDQYIDLRPGRMSDIGQNSHSVLLTHDTRIENAIGGRGNDRLVGNELNNVLVGGSGNDRLEGRGGTNMLMGGVGNDTYVWRMGDAWSTIDEDRGAGRDEIHVHGNHSTVNAPFGTINDLTDDFLFRRIGRDLRIDFTINQGEAVGGLTIKDMAWGGSRVETLRMFGVTGQQIGPAVNLDSIFILATDVAQRFRLTETQTPLGFLAVPV
jgi:hypothetical protein